MPDLDITKNVLEWCRVKADMLNRVIDFQLVSNSDVADVELTPSQAKRLIKIIERELEKLETTDGK